MKKTLFPKGRSEAYTYKSLSVRWPIKAVFVILCVACIDYLKPYKCVCFCLMVCIARQVVQTTRTSVLVDHSLINDLLGI